MDIKMIDLDTGDAHMVRTEEGVTMADGEGCACAASCEGECGCEGVDWTPAEVYALRAEAERLRAHLRVALSFANAQVPADWALRNVIIIIGKALKTAGREEDQNERPI